MKKQGSIFIIFSLLLFTSCGTKNETTSEFENYLRNMNGTSPVNGAVYLLVPGNQCKNCVMLDAQKIPDSINENVYVISSLKQKHFKNFRHYTHDKNDRLLELKLLDYENKLLLYDHNQVMAVVNVKVSPFGDTTINSCEDD